MVDLLQFDDSLGVIVMSGDQTLEVFPKELKVISERFATLVESTSRVSELLENSEYVNTFFGGMVSAVVHL
jgi:hypothetical protein